MSSLLSASQRTWKRLVCINNGSLWKHGCELYCGIVTKHGSEWEKVCRSGVGCLHGRVGAGSPSPRPLSLSPSHASPWCCLPALSCLHFYYDEKPQVDESACPSCPCLGRVSSNGSAIWATRVCLQPATVTPPPLQPQLGAGPRAPGHTPGRLQ